MIRGITYLLVLVFFIPGRSLAQGNCPEGFGHAGTLSGTGSFMTPFDQRVTLRLPENATLDESFQQKKLQPTNGKGGVQSKMRPSDVPKGLLLVVYGQSDKVYERGGPSATPNLRSLNETSTARFPNTSLE